MKKLMIVAAFGAAAILTACGDDSSSNASGAKTQLDGKSVVSCDMVSVFGGVESHTCAAIAADDPDVAEFKADCAADNEFDKSTYTLGTGCAAADLTCNIETGVMYFYGEGLGGFSCDQMLMD